MWKGRGKGQTKQGKGQGKKDHYKKINPAVIFMYFICTNTHKLN